MFKIIKISRFIISAATLLLLGGTSHLVSADGLRSLAPQAYVATSATGIPRAVQLHVSHLEGLRSVSWYDADTEIFEDVRNYSDCPYADEILLPDRSHVFHDHYIVVVPCKYKAETFKATYEEDKTEAEFVGFGNTVENGSSIAMEITDINLDGIPDIVAVDNSSGLVIPTIMLGVGDGTFEEIADSVYYTGTDPNTPSTPSFNVSINPTSGPSGTPVTIKVTGAEPGASVSVVIKGFGSHGYKTNASGEVTIPETMFGSVGETVTIQVQINGSAPPYPMEKTVTFKITGFQQNQISDLTVNPRLDFQRR